MTVVTKKGDQGQTGLFSGERTSKGSGRIEAIGSIDELNSAIGLLLADKPAAEIIEELRDVQRHCFTIGAMLATPADSSPERANYIPRLTADEVGFLEEKIGSREPLLPRQSKFILPGGSKSAALCFWVRAIARRAERAVVGLAEGEEVNPLILQYLNRLSDYFFILGRWFNKEAHIHEITWR